MSGQESRFPIQGGTIVDADSADWLKSLNEVGPSRNEAVGRLHELLLRAARSEVRRRSHQLRLVGPELDDLAHQAAADALVAITAKLDQFRGESRFTTWAYKFVIFEVSTKMSRHFWRRTPVPLTDDLWERIPQRFGAEPDRAVEAKQLVDAMREAVEHDLTEHQRRIFIAIVVEAVPLDVLVAQLSSTRGAIYKTLFDARRKLRQVLVTNGYLEGHDAVRQP